MYWWFQKDYVFNHDQFNFKIISVLRGVEGVSYFEDLRRDQIVFFLPLTPLTTKILYPSIWISFKLKDLLRGGGGFKHKCWIIE